MTPPAPTHFTAAELARALSRPARSIRRVLAVAPADGRREVAGQMVNAWSLAALPARLQTELEERATREGFRHALALLLARGAAAPVPPRARASKPRLPSLGAELEFQELKPTLGGFFALESPAPDDRTMVWLRVMECLERKLAEGKPANKTKRLLCEFLARSAPFLFTARAADAMKALRVNLDRRWQGWVDTGGDVASQKDQRLVKSGFFRAPELTQNELDDCISLAVNQYSGDVAPAYRQMCRELRFSQAFLAHHLNNPANKSHVPKRVMEQVKYEIARLDDIHHGAKQHALNGAFIDRHYRNMHSMDWLQSDDVTEPVYFKRRDAHGLWMLTRGQVLPMIDVRSLCVLGFVLLSDRNYGANSIRGLITAVCNMHGLPRHGFYFENGSWRAKIIKGDERAGPLSWDQTELGLREFGLEFRHAQKPRAKQIEGVIGILQNLMEGMPGYVGRNEQVEKFERVQKLKLAAERQDPAALAQFMDEDQWAEELQKICERYNADPQNGKITEGMAPDEAFARFRHPTDPPVIFSPECRYLLAHHRRQVNVTPNGITLYFGKQMFNYRNADTGRLVGERVLAWFDPDNPEILTVTNLDREKAFCVGRSQSVPAMDAPPDVLSQELGRIAEHQAYAKTRYRILKARYETTFRPMVADRKTVALGEQIAQGREALETKQREVGRRAQTIQRRSRALGLPASIAADGPEAEEGLRMMQDAHRAQATPD